MIWIEILIVVLWFGGVWSAYKCGWHYGRAYEIKKRGSLLANMTRLVRDSAQFGGNLGVLKGREK